MGQIQLRVGASIDRSVSTVFSEIAETAKRANRTVQQEAKATARAESQAVKERLREEEQAAKELERWAKQAHRERSKEASDRVSANKRALAEIEREERQATSAFDREAKKRMSIARREGDEAIANRRKAAAEVSRSNQQLVSSMRNIGGMLGSGAMALGRFGMSVVGDIAAGAGVDLNMGSQFTKATDLSSMAVQLSNQGYMPGQGGPNGRRQDPKDLERAAFEIGNKTGTSANDVMEGMTAFVSRTGDLEAARGSMENLSRLSLATGSNLKDMAEAAGDASNQIGDIPNKAKVIDEVMRAVAGQGKLGAVEIKDMAKQMAKVAAQANLMEGDVGENIKLFGAIGQEARQRGGAASPQQAATSIGAMMDTFSKGARIHAFQAQGINIEGEGGKIRNIQKIITESLQKTQKSSASATNEAFGSLFASAQSRRAVRGFETSFRSTYAETKGTDQEKMAAATKAVTEEFERLKSVTMTTQEVQDSFNVAMGGGKAQANVFNNQLEQLAGQVKDQLTPAMIGLVPVVTHLTGEMGTLLTKLFPPDRSKDLAGAGATADKTLSTGADILRDPSKFDKGTIEKQRETDAATRSKLAVARTSKEIEVQGLKNQKGHTDLPQGAWEQITKGGWGNLAGGALAIGIGAERRTKGIREARGAAIQKGEQEVAHSGTQIDQLDKQTTALSGILNSIKDGTLKVRIVADDTSGQGTSKGPPNAAGPQNEGLEPNQ